MRIPPLSQLIHSKISPNLWYSEATRTDRAEFVEINRKEGRDFLGPMSQLAGILEMVRHGWVVRDSFCRWMDVGSWFRGMSLNDDVGGVLSSQHLYGGAADVRPNGLITEQRVQAGFESAIRTLTESNVMFGQLIMEKKYFGVSWKPPVFWIHLSLGWPYRRLSRCREIFTMTKLPGQRSRYHLDQRLSSLAWKGTA